MPRYAVRMHITYGANYYVTADSPQSAREEAWRLHDRGSDGEDTEYERIETEIIQTDVYTGPTPDTTYPE